MKSMFSSASAFNQDLSKWDVSAVTNMKFMFSSAFTFDQDLSKWDVSAVTNMEYMFYSTSAFNHELCGRAWVTSEADQHEMFRDSPGSISSTECATARSGKAFAPHSKSALR